MVLVGRGVEFGSVAAVLDDVAAGTGRAVGLVGEAGIGKTRLAEEAVALAGQRGFAVLAGRAPMREMAVAYAPFLEAIGDYLRSLDVVARAATTSGLPELSVLFGSLVHGRVEPLSDPALEQARLFEAVARLLERVQQRGPTVLFVDDAHEADTASIMLLHYLCRRLDGQRVLTLLTYRSDADSLRPLRQFRAAMSRQGLLHEVALERLGRAPLAELAAAWLEGPPSEALLDLLDICAGGVPLFTEAILAGLRDTGQVTWAGGCWTLTSAGAPDVPALARDVVLRPLDRLASDDRRLADILAVAGESVPHDRLAAVAAVDEDALGAGVGRLRAAGLLDEVVANGRVSYRLHHPLLLEVAYAELGEVARRRLHATFAVTLERDEPVDLQRLARHYRGAGTEADGDRARGVLAAAGERALALHANRDAVAHLSAALELQRASGPPEGVGGLLELLGDALERIGECAAAVSIWEEALPLVTGAGDVLRAGRVHRRLAAAEWERGRLGHVRAHLRRGVEVLSTHEPSCELAELRLTEVRLRTWMHDFDAAAHASGELAGLASRLGSPTASVEALLAESRLRLAQAQPQSAVQTAVRTLAAAEAAGDPLLLWHAHTLMVICVVWDGDHRIIRHHASAALALARKLGIPGLELRSSAMMAAGDFFAGDWESAFSWAGGVLQQAPLVGQPRAAVHSVAMVAVLHGYRGDTAAVERVLVEVEAAYGRLDHDLGVQVLLVAAEILIALGRHQVEAAIALVDQTLPRVQDGFGGWLLLSAGEAYLCAGRWEAALALTPRIASTAPSQRSMMAGEALRIEGVAQMGLGAPDRALACLHEARALFSHLDAPFFVARAGLDWGRVRGGPQGAVAVQDSLAVFEQLGAGLYAEQARRVLREVGAKVPRRRAPVVGPLSPRERQVACLAAEGLTTTQIAGKLVISPHTSRTHLKRIHQRLGVSSRAELTRFVVDAGWLTDTAT